MSAPAYSPMRQKVIILAAVLDLIDDMFDLRTFGADHRPADQPPAASVNRRSVRWAS
jgi:hypothetical protein